MWLYLLQDAAFGAACVPLLQDNERNIATMVRFIFHDCVGGCDGCVDTELEESTHGDRVNAGNIFLDCFQTLYNCYRINSFTCLLTICLLISFCFDTAQSG